MRRTFWNRWAFFMFLFVWLEQVNLFSCLLFDLKLVLSFVTKSCQLQACWVMLINVVAMDMLRSKIPPGFYSCARLAMSITDPCGGRHDGDDQNDNYLNWTYLCLTNDYLNVCNVSFISPLSLHLVYTCSDSSDQLRNAETFKHSNILLVYWERLKCKTALKPGSAEQRIEQAWSCPTLFVYLYLRWFVCCLVWQRSICRMISHRWCGRLNSNETRHRAELTGAESWSTGINSTEQKREADLIVVDC